MIDYNNKKPVKKYSGHTSGHTSEIRPHLRPHLRPAFFSDREGGEGGYFFSKLMLTKTTMYTSKAQWFRHMGEVHDPVKESYHAWHKWLCIKYFEDAYVKQNLRAARAMKRRYSIVREFRDLCRIDIA